MRIDEMDAPFFNGDRLELLMRLNEAKQQLDPAAGEIKRLECRQCKNIIGLANRSGVYLASGRVAPTDARVLRQPTVIACPRCGMERRIH